MTPEDVRKIYDRHRDYWDRQRPKMRSLKALYMTRFWRDHQQPATLPDQTRVELSKGYKVVESYIGSLYARNPGVMVGPDLRRRGDPDVAQATGNEFLRTTRDQIEDATRLGLIFPCGFLKLAPRNNPDPLKRVTCSPVRPWEVIVDETATAWDSQRYVGHTYLMPLEEARQKFGRSRALSSSDFTTRTYTSWIDAPDDGGARRTPSTNRRRDDTEAATDDGQWIRVVELYDLLDDLLLTWSPDYRSGERFLFDGVTVQVGALDPSADAETAAEGLDSQVETVESGIPYKTASGRPVVPIIPMYYSRDPEIPMRGYSPLHRVRDQLVEANIFRTYQARGVRRMARQWLVRAGFLSEVAKGKISEGIDGEFIEVDMNSGEDLTGQVIPVPNEPIPADINLYTAQVMQDIDDAGVLAPFTRGEATNTTATEQRLLASYTSSEIGRMARIRDAAISELARVYNIMLSVVLGEEAEPIVLPGMEPAMLSASDLTGDFTYWATASGSTPMSDMAKQDALVSVADLLVQFGVPPEAIREEMVRAFQFPESFNPPPAPEVPEVSSDVAQPALRAGLPSPAPPAPGAAPGVAPGPLAGPGLPPDGVV